MVQSVAVLLLDDGELDDVQEMLESMKIPFGRVRGASIVSGTPGPTDLLIATPRRIDAVREIRDGHPEGSAPVRIVVVNEDSNSLRDQLRRVGFDYIVRRPVHPEAMRLLILHSLYAGEERRVEPRVPVGFEITFRTGIVSRRAILADLSTRGCRLLSRHAVGLGKRLRIQIPEELGAAEPLTLRARVLRTTFDPSQGEAGLNTIAVLFEKIPNEARQELEWIIEARAQGPPRLDERGPVGEASEAAEDERGIVEIPARNLQSDPRFEKEDLALPEPSQLTAGSRRPDAAQRASQPSDRPGEFHKVEGGRAEAARPPKRILERRTARRAAFAAKIPAFGSRALRVLVGRDISRKGMRVDANPDLALGDRLHLAIYGEAEQEPFLIWSTVERSDGELGLFIAFDDVHEVIAAQLEKLVASLPAVESLVDGEDSAMGTVISEILSEEAG